MSDERLGETLISQGRAERRARLRLEAGFLASGGDEGI